MHTKHNLKTHLSALPPNLQYPHTHRFLLHFFFLSSKVLLIRSCSETFLCPSSLPDLKLSNALFSHWILETSRCMNADATPVTHEFRKFQNTSQHHTKPSLLTCLVPVYLFLVLYLPLRHYGARYPFGLGASSSRPFCHHKQKQSMIRTFHFREELLPRMPCPFIGYTTCLHLPSLFPLPPRLEIHE